MLVLIVNKSSDTENLSLADFIVRVSESNFVIRVKDFRWFHEKAVGVTDAIEFEVEGGFDHDSNDYSRPIKLIEYKGWRCITSRFGGCSITYMEDISFIDNQPDSFIAHSCIGNGANLILENIIVTNEDGEKISANELIKYLPSSFTEMGDCGKEYLVGDESEDSEFYSEDEYDITGFAQKRFVSTYSWDIEATVKEMAVVRSEWGEGGLGAHQMLTIGLYQGYSGRFICSRSLISRISGKASIHEAVVANNEAEVRAFFGAKALASELYWKVGLKK
ncbi:MAG: hypothetical protein VYA60_10725 [Pseudomonadota bacterium]|nr:hypothetical protein [Pseudomonadota bacterium]